MKTSCNDNLESSIEEFFGNALKFSRSKRNFLTKGDLLRISAMGTDFPNNLFTEEDNLDVIFEFLDLNGDGRVELGEFQTRFISYLKSVERNQENSQEIFIEKSSNDKMNKDSLDELDEDDVITETEGIIDPALMKNLLNINPKLKPKVKKLMSLMVSSLRRNRQENKRLERLFEENLAKRQIELKNLSEQLDARLKEFYRENEGIPGKSDCDQIAELQAELISKQEAVTELEQRFITIAKLTTQYRDNLSHAHEELEKLYLQKSELEEALASIEACIAESQLVIEELHQEWKEGHLYKVQRNSRLGMEIAEENEQILQEIYDLREANRKLRDAKDEEYFREIMEHDLSNTKVFDHTQGENTIVFNQINGAFHEEELNNDEVYEIDEDLVSLSMDLRRDRKPFSQEARDRLKNHPIIEECEELDEWKTDISGATITREMLDQTRGQTDSIISEQPSENDIVERTFMDSRTKTSLCDVVKIIFIGSFNVGKTTFINKFCNIKTDVTSSTFKSTLGLDFHMVNYHKHDKGKILIQFWDTSGNKSYQSLYKHYLRRSDGIIFMYSVQKDENESIGQLKGWSKMVDESLKGLDCPVFMFLGNKGETTSLHEMKVDDVVGDLVQKYEASHYFTNAHNGQNVNEAIDDLMEKLCTVRETKREASKYSVPEPKKGNPCCCECCSSLCNNPLQRIFFC